MNTIIIDRKDYIIENQNCKIDIKVKKLDLTIKGIVHIYDQNNLDELELNIEVLDKAKLIYHMFSENDFKIKNITIKNQENSKTEFHYSLIHHKNAIVNLNNYLNENNIESNLKVRAVAIDDATIEVNSNGYVAKDTKENIFNEDIRGLNLENGMITINPNMYIDTNEVIANHNATISNVNKDYLFYLGTKGIEKDSAVKLIINGFINSILSEHLNKNS